jgi:hypothetical protein
MLVNCSDAEINKNLDLPVPKFRGLDKAIINITAERYGQVSSYNKKILSLESGNIFICLLDPICDLFLIAVTYDGMKISDRPRRRKL